MKAMILKKTCNLDKNRNPLELAEVPEPIIYQDAVKQPKKKGVGERSIFRVPFSKRGISAGL
jgi:hypothetical protein